MDVSAEIREQVDLIRVAASSDLPSAFLLCVRHVAGLVGPLLSKQEAVDSLNDAAVSYDLVKSYGEDAVQGWMAQGFSEPIIPDEEDDPLVGNTASDAPPPQYSEDAIALRFASQHVRDLRYVDLWKRWLSWDGKRWAPDETQHTRGMLRQTHREIAKSCIEETKSRGLARAIASKKAIDGVQNLTGADFRIAAHPDQFDRDEWALNTPSGVVSLLDGTLRPNRAEDYCTKITAVAPDPRCSIATWLRFLDRVTESNNDLIAFLKRMTGYALTGSIREHALFFVYGPGGSGKSTFLNAITRCLGDYHGVAPIETFLASKNERHPTDIASLRGKRIVTATETEEGRRWDQSKVKVLTGGDEIAARFMRADFFVFLPIFKLIIAGNHLPGLGSVDEAMRRRCNVVPFTAAIPKSDRDPELGLKLQREWPGILQWMIDGCLEWQRRGLDAPAIVRQTTEGYFEAEDVLGAWIEQAGIRLPEAWAFTEDLFAAWRKYATGAGEYVGSITKFSQRLQDRGQLAGLQKGRHKATGRRGFYGLRLFEAYECTPAPDESSPQSSDEVH